MRSRSCSTCSGDVAELAVLLILGVVAGRTLAALVRVVASRALRAHDTQGKHQGLLGPAEGKTRARSRGQSDKDRTETPHDNGH
jgi:hypothetical protein